MAQTMSKTQLPLGDEDVAMFERGVAVGRDAASAAVRKVAAWAEEHPGQLVLAGLALGFVLGKLLFRERHIEVD